MWTKKIISIAMVSAAVLFSTESANAFSFGNIFKKSGVDPQHLIEELQNDSSDLKGYLSSKDYSSISNVHIKEVVQHLCKEGCNRVTCKKGPIKAGCAKFCPSDDVKNCVKA